MNKEMAEKIQQAFGPCTSIFEAMTIDEIVEDYTGGRYQNLESYIQCQLDVESVCSERVIDAASYQEKTDLKAVKEEMVAFRADILRRLKEAGFEKEFN